MATPLNAMNADHIAPMAGGFQPQLQNDFSIEFTGLSPENQLDNEIIRLSLDAGFLPQESSEEVELHYLNEKRYIAGKVNFESGTVVVKDFVDAGTMSAVQRWRQQVYNPLTGAVGFASVYKRTGTIRLLRPDGRDPERQWILQGCWPQAVNYGSLDMTANDLVKIEMTIRYDKAIPAKGFTSLSTLAAGLVDPTVIVPGGLAKV